MSFDLSAATMPMFDAQIADLEELTALGRRRRLRARAGRDFSSNDYLGLAGSPRITAAVTDAIRRGVPLGSGGSRLLRGNHAEHEQLEDQAARFFGCESALFFASGYAANAVLFSTLPQRGDLVVHDALVHASAHEGLRSGRAERQSAMHNDPQAFADAIRAWRHAGGVGRVWIAVESLYSMDGDQAPLAALADIAARHDAVLLIDEAHATGVFGPDGRGLAAAYEGEENVITLRTCGKALGCEGALLCGPQIMRDFLINRGRAFIFSTAPSPLIAVAVRAALGLLITEPERRTRLHALIGHAQPVLARHDAAATGSPITPIVLGDEARTMRAAERLQQLGFDVRGVRPPTVPVGTSRLRLSLTLNIGLDDVRALDDALGEALI